MASSFNTVVSNDLDEVQMIAGDTRTFVYTIYDENSTLVNLAGATCVVNIFKYGDISSSPINLTGTVTSMPTIGEFSVTLNGTLTHTLSGVYQQQIKITDSQGVVHRPSQGKIIIFPAPPLF